MQETLLGFVSLGILSGINIAVAAYGYGMLKKQVNGVTDRVGRLEDRNAVDDHDARRGQRERG